MKKRNIFWGIFFIVAAVAVIASQVGLFVQIGVWSIIAVVLLAVWLIRGISRVSFIEITLSLALLYIVLQKPLALFFLSPWLLIIAALLVGIGLSLLIRRRPRWASQSHWNNGGHSSGANGDEQYIHGVFRPEATIVTNDDDSFPTAKVSFGTTNRYLHSQNIVRGEFAASFGSLEIYLDQAKLAPEGAEFFIECSFGYVKLFVPRSWTVRDNVTASLGAITNDTRYARPEGELPTLQITGNVSFGNIEVAYV